MRNAHKQYYLPKNIPERTESTNRHTHKHTLPPPPKFLRQMNLFSLVKTQIHFILFQLSKLQIHSLFALIVSLLDAGGCYLFSITKPNTSCEIDWADLLFLPKWKIALMRYTINCSCYNTIERGLRLLCCWCSIPTPPKKSFRLSLKLRDLVKDILVIV